MAEDTQQLFMPSRQLHAYKRNLLLACTLVIAEWWLGGVTITEGFGLKLTATPEWWQLLALKWGVLVYLGLYYRHSFYQEVKIWFIRIPSLKQLYNHLSSSELLIVHDNKDNKALKDKAQLETALYHLIRRPERTTWNFLRRFEFYNSLKGEGVNALRLSVAPLGRWWVSFPTIFFWLAVIFSIFSAAGAALPDIITYFWPPEGVAPDCPTP